MTSQPSREQLIAANEDAAEFYRRHLLGHDGVGPRHYLAQRGFAALLDDTPWTVGHAPAAWGALHEHLSGLGYSDQVQLAAGLTSLTRRGHQVDRFRDRLTFGIRNQQDDLVGFTARTSPDGRDPKYLNTPKTELFEKSQVLFGLGEAARSPALSCVLVEGPLDAIAVNLAGPTGSVSLALCGTALTDTHVQIIQSSSYERLVLALDGDSAGARALENAAAALHDTRLFAVHHPGKDPASVLASDGILALSHALSSARPATEVLVDLTLAKWPDRLENAEAALGCLRETAHMISRVRPSDLATLAAKLGRATNLPLHTITAELAEGVSTSAARGCVTRESPGDTSEGVTQQRRSEPRHDRICRSGVGHSAQNDAGPGGEG